MKSREPSGPELELKAGRVLGDGWKGTPGGQGAPEQSTEVGECDVIFGEILCSVSC